VPDALTMPDHAGTGSTVATGVEADATYAKAGVDIAAGEEAVERIRGLVASTARPEVLGAIGGFAGCFALEAARYRDPVLVASTDGVGTKALIAEATGRFDTIGIDLVAMCVDDLVCTGAEPLFLLDYVATGRLEPEKVEAIVAGVAEGCRQAGCALLGGEMAEHPGAMPAGRFDLAGFAVGVVERGRMLGAERVVPGDALVGLHSPGLRSNGYSLARHVLLESAGRSLDSPAWEGASHSLGRELLEPSVVYARSVLAALSVSEIHAVAHITGGGIASNLSRVLPDGVVARLERASWEVPRIFEEIAAVGSVPWQEMERVFNLGLGMVLVVGANAVDDALAALGAAGQRAFVAGKVEAVEGGTNRRGAKVELVGGGRSRV
jgi:phosphoribosylformylglycinamidine cyclo-ligase